MIHTLLLTLALATTARAETTSIPPIAPEFRARGEVVSLPFTMVHEFPFVAATVNGVRGKLLLDTGDQNALSLNHNHIPLPEGRPIGQGQFGSGQTFQVILRPRVDRVTLAGGLTYGPITTVKSQDAAQLEHITPDFLGWLGYDFWDGDALKMDYRASRITFYRGGPKAFLKGETVLAKLPFTLPKLPNHPVLMVKVGDTGFQAVLDTGQYGNLYTDPEALKRLVAAGAVRPVKGEDAPADVKAKLVGGPTIGLPHLATHDRAAAASFAKPIGLEAPNILSLGYAFLRQYKTVWDYPNRTLYLLKR